VSADRGKACGAPAALLELAERAPGGAPAADSVTLDFRQRQRSRLRVRLDGGGEAAIRLARGEVLRGGDRLRAPCGRVVEVRAARERISQVASEEPRALARAAYHLGNRHVAVEIGAGWIRYQHDHVLDRMLAGLGLLVAVLDAPFEPEPGAYAGHHHGHRHDVDPGL